LELVFSTLGQAAAVGNFIENNSTKLLVNLSRFMTDNKKLIIIFKI